jgi:hypothetical protein
MRIVTSSPTESGISQMLTIKSHLLRRLLQAIATALLCGLIFLRLGNDQTSAWNRLGLLFFLALNQSFAAAMTAIQVCMVLIA